MRKICFLFGIIIGILILAGGVFILFYKKTPGAAPMDEQILSGKKIVMVVAFKDFRDEEYFVPKEILEKAGAEIKTASNQKGVALGADGGEIEIDLLVSEINPTVFDAVVFIGGPGCLENLDNEDSYNVAKETLAESKLLAAICVSPVILAKAGVLQGKSAAVWSSPMDKSAIEILEQHGVNFDSQDVVVDGRIVTANGPAAAQKFANTLINILK